MTMGKNVVDIYWFPIRFVTYSLVLLLLVSDDVSGVQGPNGAQSSVIGRCTKQCSSVSIHVHV